jgi:hypothetical protein
VNAGKLRSWRGPLALRRSLVSAQACQGFGAQSRITRGQLTNEIEEQRQRPRCTVRDRFMLQCTLLR